MPPFYADCKFFGRGEGPELSCDDHDVVKECKGLKGFFGFGTSVTCPREDCKGEFVEQPCDVGVTSMKRTYRVNERRIGIGRPCPFEDGFTETEICPFDMRYEKVPLKVCPKRGKNETVEDIAIDVPWLDAIYENTMEECAARCDKIPNCSAFTSKEWGSNRIGNKVYRGTCDFHFKEPECSLGGTSYRKRKGYDES